MELATAFIPLKFSELDKFKAQMGQIKSSLVSELGGGLLKGLGILGVAVGIGATITKSISSAMEAEAAIADLKDALEANGEEVESNIKSMKEWAENVSKSTILSKKQAYSLAESALKYGKNASEAKSYSTTAIGLAEKLGISQEEALDSLLRLSNGDERALRGLAKRSEAIKNATGKTALLAAVNSEAAKGMQMLHWETGTTKEQWNQLEKSIGKIYTTLGNAFLPILQAVLPAIQDFAEWIGSLIGTMNDYNLTMTTANSTTGKTNSLWEGFKSICKGIKEYIEAVVFALDNWDLYAKRIGLSWAETFTHIWDRIKYFFTNWKEIGLWGLNNWKGIMIDIGNLWITAWANSFEWFKDNWKQTLAFIASGGVSSLFLDTTNFNPLKGFQSSISKEEWNKLPKLKLTDFSDQYRELDREENKRMKKWQDAAIKNKPKTVEEAAKGLDAQLGGITIGNKSKGSGGGFSAIGEGWKKMQEQLTKSEEMKMQKDIAKNTKDAAKGIEKMNQNLSRLKTIAVTV